MPQNKILRYYAKQKLPTRQLDRKIEPTDDEISVFSVDKTPTQTQRKRERNKSLKSSDSDRMEAVQFSTVASRHFSAASHSFSTSRRSWCCRDGTSNDARKPSRFRSSWTGSRSPTSLSSRNLFTVSQISNNKLVCEVGLCSLFTGSIAHM